MPYSPFQNQQSKTPPILGFYLRVLFFLLTLALVFTLAPQEKIYAVESNECITAVGTVSPNQPTPIGCNNKTASGSGSTDGAIGGNPDGKFAYYCQGNPIWKDNCSLGDAGCGPTSLAMLMSTFGDHMTPPEVDSVFQRSGWRGGCAAGSDIYAAIHSQWFLSRGYTVPEVDLIDGNGKPLLGEMSKYLNQGYLIILNGHNYPCKGCLDRFVGVGHYVIVDAVDVAGQRIHTRDPNNCSYSTGAENTALAWTDMRQPRSVGGGADSTYNIYPVKK